MRGVGGGCIIICVIKNNIAIIPGVGGEIKQTYISKRLKDYISQFLSFDFPKYFHEHILFF